MNITSRVAFILYQSLFMVGDLGKCNSGIRYTDKSDGTTKANFFIIDSFCIYDIRDDLIKLGGPWPNLEDYFPKEAEGYIVLHNENIFAGCYLDIVKNRPENMSDKEAEQHILIEGIKKILPHSIEKHDLALRYLLDELKRNELNDYGLRPQLARDLPLYRDAINKRHITIIDQFIEKAKELGLSEELQKLIEIKKYSEQYIAEMDFDSRMGYIKDIMDRYKKGYDSGKIDKYKLPKYTFPEYIEMYKYKNFELMENALQELEIAPEITSDCSVSQVFESQVAM